MGSPTSSRPAAVRWLEAKHLSTGRIDYHSLRDDLRLAAPLCIKQQQPDEGTFSDHRPDRWNP